MRLHGCSFFLLQVLKNQEAEKPEENTASFSAIKDAMSSIGESVQGLVSVISGGVQSGQEVKPIDWGNTERGRNEAFDKFFKEGNSRETINKIFKVQEAEKSEEDSVASSVLKGAMSSIGESVQGLVSVISGVVQSGQEVKPIDRGYDRIRRIHGGKFWRGDNKNKRWKLIVLERHHHRHQKQVQLLLMYEKSRQVLESNTTI